MYNPTGQEATINGFVFNAAYLMPRRFLMFLRWGGFLFLFTFMPQVVLGLTFQVSTNPVAACPNGNSTVGTITLKSQDSGMLLPGTQISLTFSAPVISAPKPEERTPTVTFSGSTVSVFFTNR